VLFETLEYPALMHCKSGADRAGIMSVLYAHFRLGLPIREAMDQLSPRYLHIKAGQDRRAGLHLRALSERGEPKGLTFTEWVESPTTIPVAMKADFRAGMLGKVLTERLLRRE
jgi:protein tyrosine/serine phosphatase